MFVIRFVFKLNIRFYDNFKKIVFLLSWYDNVIYYIVKFYEFFVFRCENLWVWCSFKFLWFCKNRNMYVYDVLIVFSYCKVNYFIDVVKFFFKVGIFWFFFLYILKLWGKEI